MHGILEKFINFNYKIHLIVSLIIRGLLIAYGIYHDQYSTVRYTDIDYKVFTDAARYILNNKSPYLRHTYRYTPLVAILMIPNILLHHSFGKILFSIVDLIDGILIRGIVKGTLQEYSLYKVTTNNDRDKSEQQNYPAIVGRNRKKSKHSRSTSKFPRTTQNNIDNVDRICNISMIAWLYNPLTVAIGTRGNCDSIAVFFVLLTLYLLQCKRSYLAAGIIHGVSIHFRLYPIMYSLTYFMYLSKFSFYSTEDRRKIKNNDETKQITGRSDGQIIPTNEMKERRTIFKKEYLLYLIPNTEQFQLVVGCLLSLFSLTGLCYLMYGYTFLYETYIYHLIRKDTRHNFSLYFYLQYLTAWIKNVGIWQKVLIVFPQIILLVVFSFRYGLNRFSLNFSVLTQTVVMVTYNSVITSQYFVWILAILPLCLWQINMALKNAAFLLFIWFAAQGAWLLPAYLLEFQGQNTFLFIWIQSVSFFCANIAILGRLIMNFMPLKEKFE